MVKVKENYVNGIRKQEKVNINIKINEFGEVISNINIDQLNSYLDKKVVDKKLQKID